MATHSRYEFRVDILRGLFGVEIGLTLKLVLAIIERCMIIMSCILSYFVARDMKKLLDSCHANCLLFGRIYEVKRVVEPGHTGWCYSSILAGILTCILCIFLLWRRCRTQSGAFQKTCLLLSGCGALCSLTNGLVLHTGFQSWCSTFVLRSCGQRHIKVFTDWKMFEPKYLDGSDSTLLIMKSLHNCYILFPSLLALSVLYLSNWYWSKGDQEFSNLELGKSEWGSE